MTSPTLPQTRAGRASGAMRTGNARLRAALLDAGLRNEDLASRLGVEPKTVERWVSQGRVPYARHAHRAAQELHTEVHYLWPQLEVRANTEPRDEMLACHASRAAVPLRLWRDLLSAAQVAIDISVNDGLFVVDAVADLIAVLTERAAAGVRVRIALPDPDHAATPLEAARAALADEAFAEIAAVPGVRIARHAGVTNDVIRADDDVLVTTGVDGCPAAASPVLHLRRLAGAPLTGLYLTGLEHVFATAVPRRRAARTPEMAR
ncbi:helix-turn-helix domain-containing protein [Streptomyces hirsutus]